MIKCPWNGVMRCWSWCCFQGGRNGYILFTVWHQDASSDAGHTSSDADHTPSSRFKFPRQVTQFTCQVTQYPRQVPISSSMSSDVVHTSRDVVHTYTVTHVLRQLTQHAVSILNAFRTSINAFFDTTVTQFACVRCARIFAQKTRWFKGERSQIINGALCNSFFT